MPKRKQGLLSAYLSLARLDGVGSLLRVGVWL